MTKYPKLDQALKDFFTIPELEGIDLEESETVQFLEDNQFYNVDLATFHHLNHSGPRILDITITDTDKAGYHSTSHYLHLSGLCEQSLEQLRDTLTERVGPYRWTNNLLKRVYYIVNVSLRLQQDKDDPTRFYFELMALNPYAPRKTLAFHVQDGNVIYDDISMSIDQMEQYLVRQMKRIRFTELVTGGCRSFSITAKRFKEYIHVAIHRNEIIS